MNTTTKDPRRARPAVKLWAATAALALTAVFAQGAFAAPDDAMGATRHMHGHGGEMAGGMGGGMGWASPRGIGRALDAVNATAEQRSQIQALLAAAKPDFEQQRAASRALHEQAGALWSQPTVDARAAETLRQQTVAQHDQSSRRMLQLALDVSRVLTPAQRQQLAELRRQHAAERGSRGGPAGRN